MRTPRSTTVADILRAGVGVAILLLCSVDTVHSIKYPPVPSLETISGSWIAVREHGGVCRLVLDGPTGTGEMSCFSGEREYRTDVSGIKLRRNKLTVLLGSAGDQLEGEVVRSRFAARLGRERIFFFTEQRIVSEMTKVGLSTCEPRDR